MFYSKFQSMESHRENWPWRSRFQYHRRNIIPDRSDQILLLGRKWSLWPSVIRTSVCCSAIFPGSNSIIMPNPFSISQSSSIYTSSWHDWLKIHSITYIGRTFILGQSMVHWRQVSRYQFPLLSVQSCFSISSNDIQYHLEKTAQNYFWPRLNPMDLGQ